MKKLWLGGIYIKDEGGFEIILKSLNHYKKRLETIPNSPELKNSAGMFASVLTQEALKTIPEIKKTTQRIKDCLSGKLSYKGLKEDLPIIKKALTCYESDIKKAGDTRHEYFLALVDTETTQGDLTKIKEAITKIDRFE